MDLKGNNRDVIKLLSRNLSTGVSCRTAADSSKILIWHLPKRSPDRYCYNNRPLTSCSFGTTAGHLEIRVVVHVSHSNHCDTLVHAALLQTFSQTAVEPRLATEVLPQYIHPSTLVQHTASVFETESDAKRSVHTFRRKGKHAVSRCPCVSPVVTFSGKGRANKPRMS
jgi:hypothetical protein